MNTEQTPAWWSHPDHEMNTPSRNSRKVQNFSNKFVARWIWWVTIG